jgi:hypothetical protein
LTASASYKIKVGQPGAQAKLTIFQAAVKSAVEALRSTIEQQIYIIGKCKFLMDSKILNCANKTNFREKLPLGMNRKRGYL